MKKTWTIKPYNDFWLDCINNNLISILLEKDESYRGIIQHLGVSYVKKISTQSFDSEGTRSNLAAQGLFSPKIKYSYRMLENLIEQEDYRLEGVIPQEVERFIISKLDMGYCVFASVDRYFYPSGRESGRMHLIHPVFIHGYDEREQYFHTIEDCFTPGKMEYYDLPYYSFKDSCRHFADQDQMITVNICRAKQDLKSLSQLEDPAHIAISMCENLLKGGNVYEEKYDLYYNTGLACLDAFIHELKEFFYKIEEYSIYKSRVLQFQQLATRNQLIVNTLKDKGVLSAQLADTLITAYSILHDEWELFKNKSFTLLAAKKRSGLPDADKLEWLVHQLAQIKTLEESAASQFIHAVNAGYRDAGRQEGNAEIYG